MEGLPLSGIPVKYLLKSAKYSLFPSGFLQLSLYVVHYQCGTILEQQQIYSYAIPSLADRSKYFSRGEYL
jgi:hypothetical protein